MTNSLGISYVESFVLFDYWGKTDAAEYGQVVHSLIDNNTLRQIITLSVSADKLQSISNYSRDPSD